MKFCEEILEKSTRLPMKLPTRFWEEEGEEFWRERGEHRTFNNLSFEATRAWKDRASKFGWEKSEIRDEGTICHEGIARV